MSECLCHIYHFEVLLFLASIRFTVFCWLHVKSANGFQIKAYLHKGRGKGGCDTEWPPHSKVQTTGKMWGILQAVPERVNRDYLPACFHIWNLCMCRNTPQLSALCHPLSSCASSMSILQPKQEAPILTQPPERWRCPLQFHLSDVQICSGCLDNGFHLICS